LLECKQPFGKICGAAKTLGRIATGRVRNVFPEQRIFNIRFPSRRERLAELADGQLVEHDAKSIDVGTGAGRLPGQDFGGQIHQCAGQRLSLKRGGLRKSQIRDSQGVKPRRIEQRRAAEVGDFDLPAALGARHDQDIGWFQILVQDANPVRGGDRLGDIDKKTETGVERDVG